MPQTIKLKKKMWHHRNHTQDYLETKSGSVIGLNHKANEGGREKKKDKYVPLTHKYTHSVLKFNREKKKNQQKSSQVFKEWKKKI